MYLYIFELVIFVLVIYIVLKSDTDDVRLPDRRKPFDQNRWGRRWRGRWNPGRRSEDQRQWP